MIPSAAISSRTQRLCDLYLYTILAPRRDELFEYLAQRGIGSQVIYPVLVPDQGAYRDQPLRSGSIPVARSLVSQILSLPMFPELRDDEIERVAAAIRTFYLQNFSNRIR